MHGVRGFVRAVAALALIAALASSPSRPVSAVGGSDYRISPQQSQVAVSALCTLSVVCDVPGDSVGCVECWVAFDPAAVTLTDAQEGSLFKNSGVGGLFFSTAIAPDTHSVEGCLLGYRTHAVTPGEVARYVFRGDVAGVTAVRITRLNIWDIDRNLVVPTVDPYAWITVATPTGATPGPPQGLRLEVWPNPFNPSTTIQVSGLERGEALAVSVFSVDGKLVRRLLDGPARGDIVSVGWNGRDGTGRRAASGVYLGVATAGGRRVVQKLVLLQ